MSADEATARHHLDALAAYGARLAVASTLEALVDTGLEALEQLLGWRHSLLLLHQPELNRLVTVASRGYPQGGAGSEVALGQGLIGMVAAKRRPMRIGNLQRMLSYARTSQGPGADPATQIALPGLADARSQLAAPMVVGGILVGVLAVESSADRAYDEVDQVVLAVAAQLLAGALEREQPPADQRPGAATVADVSPPASESARRVVLRHYAVDGSTFIDDGYVIKGVAGRLLWKVVSEHAATGRTAFTNRETKLDPSLELPEYRDNFESRLILLKRRLDEQSAPVRIRSNGRGRFELVVLAPVTPELVPRS